MKNIYEFAKKIGCDDVEYLGIYNNFKVWKLSFKSDAILDIGLPLFAIEEDEKIRLSTDDESLYFLDYFYKDIIDGKIKY